MVASLPGDCVKYRLYAFTNGRVLVITRGENEAAAMKHAAMFHVFARGTTIRAVDHLPIDANELYSQNHDFDWLNTEPLYSKEKRYV